LNRRPSEPYLALKVEIVLISYRARLSPPPTIYQRAAAVVATWEQTLEVLTGGLEISLTGG
jgi:hypothetical protein